jgi:hypothetical protein
VPLELSGSVASPGAIIKGDNAFNGHGLYGKSHVGYGVYGEGGPYGVYGEGHAYGVYGEGPIYGVYGESHAYGVYGKSSALCGVRGEGSQLGVHGKGSTGVYGEGGIGVYAEGGGIGVYCKGTVAGQFDGNVHITGALTKASGSFKIDHPLEPENKYLSHSFVESPDMMNVYNGNVTLDESGRAVVELPEYFEALNRDFRYQLTPIGAPGPNLYIAEKISDNRFKIAGGKPGMEVSWQVTGIRQDAYAVANRIQVEEDKPDQERGYYMHPKAFGLPEEKGIETVRNPRLSQTQEVAKGELSYESDRNYN